MSSLEDTLYANYPEKMELIQERITDIAYDLGGFENPEEGEDCHVYVAEIIDINVLNKLISGCFWLKDIEYSFLIECGDINGWLWRELSKDNPIPDIKYRPTKYVLQPNNDVVAKHIEKGTGKLLLQLWDVISSRPQFKKIPESYMYDKHFQPGGKIEKYWRDRAAEGKFIIVTEEEAEELKRRLEK